MTDTADQLLLDHRVFVRLAMPSHVVASVRGDHGIHSVDLTAGRWRCSCGARPTCHHVQAVQAVTVPEPSTTTKEPHYAGARTDH